MAGPKNANFASSEFPCHLPLRNMVIESVPCNLANMIAVFDMEKVLASSGGAGETVTVIMRSYMSVSASSYCFSHGRLCLLCLAYSDCVHPRLLRSVGIGALSACHHQSGDRDVDGGAFFVCVLAGKRTVLPLQRL